ncbi:MAG: isoprenylcysteine carboxylmethyltransferase family protein [Anaerolineae bacterium]|nr:MAG: isoprenylcysteine carboxylmethyltransferase family protein [Anaerolineae bacterium]
MELVFRILLLLLFIGFIANRAYTTRKAEAAGTTAQKERADTPLLKLANLLALPALMGTLAAVFSPRWMAWAALDLPDWARWAGLGVALAGFALLQWAQVTLGKNWSDRPRLLAGQELVTGGPYHWVRHPIYTAFLMILGSMLLISANWFVGGLWLAMTGIEVAARVKYEESLLAETFGKAYESYAATTGRLLPRLL